MPTTPERHLQNPDLLAKYREKRDPDETPEPLGRGHSAISAQRFVVQKHHASHIHFDLRLEMDGVLRSWAVPKGPSLDPADKRFAALVEDHPVEYADFEGSIPSGNYGAGEVIVWDRGRWEALNDTAEGLQSGKLLFNLWGYRLHGRFTLVRMKKANEWLLIKERDQYVRTEPVEAEDSIYSGLTAEEVADPAPRVQRLRRSLGRAGLPKAQVAAHIAPMLPTAHEPFSRKGWLFEVKFDGYRALLCKAGEAVHLYSRNGNNLLAAFPEIELAARRLPWDQFAIDGEITVEGSAGLPAFNALQARLGLRTTAEITAASVASPATLWAFDALTALDFDLRGLPLKRRKAHLQSLLPSTGPIRYAEHFEADGRDFYASVRKLGMEGVVGKNPNATYSSGRTSQWLKVRADRTGDYCVVGYRHARTDPTDIAALLLAEYQGNELVFMGSAGSGLSSQLRRTLSGVFETANTAEPLDQVDRACWFEPVGVCEVRYREITAAGRLRHPVILRLRDDKQPEECRSALSEAAPTIVPVESPPQVEVTNANKVFWPNTDTTKGELVRYYERIAPWMLPYLRDRPLVLTRYPDGVDGKSFYQRDAPGFVPSWIRTEVLWSKEHENPDENTRYFVIDNVESLMWIANLGTIVFHVWSSRMASLDKPDWCILDLDPKSAPFTDVVRLARTIADLCETIGLPHYLKTSGASGLHVLIPLGATINHAQSRTLGELLARAVVARHPEIATINRPLGSRGNKVYVDFGQNGHGRVLVAPFTARAEPAPQVSMPLRWSELAPRNGNTRHTIASAPRRMARLPTDPLAGVLTDKPDLIAALEALRTVDFR